MTYGPSTLGLVLWGRITRPGDSECVSWCELVLVLNNDGLAKYVASET